MACAGGSAVPGRRPLCCSRSALWFTWRACRMLYRPWRRRACSLPCCTSVTSSTRWGALAVFAGLVVADVAIGLTYMLLARGLAHDYSFVQRTQHVIYGLVGISGPVQFLPDNRSDLFNLLTSALGLFTLAVAGYLFLRPAKQTARLGEQDATKIRDLLGRHGDRDSLGYFTLRNDKSVIWSSTGKSCIGYRVVSGVMLAGGDPIGDPEAWPGAIHAFLDEAARHAWVPAVMGCGELGAEIWCREGGLTDRKSV